MHGQRTPIRHGLERIEEERELLREWAGEKSEKEGAM